MFHNLRRRTDIELHQNFIYIEVQKSTLLMRESEKIIFFAKNSPEIYSLFTAFSFIIVVSFSIFQY